MTNMLEHGRTLSAVSRDRLLSKPLEPLFIGDWDRVLMIHYEVEIEALQRVVPFDLDLCDDRAYVTLVAFTLSGMRPRFGGTLLASLMKPIATHDFLNVRTYVRFGEEPGIYFLAEWLTNKLSVSLGPPVFGLPYRYGKIDYQHQAEIGVLRGRVSDPSGLALEYYGTFDRQAVAGPCEPGSVTEALMERYTAFTRIQTKARFFRVWHQPWPQQPAQIKVTNRTLLEANWECFRGARFAGANYSRGVKDVWMGWPHRIDNSRR